MSNTLITCPFHLARIGREDRHPSLNVDLEQKVYFCHGCGATGPLSKHPELEASAKLEDRGISYSGVRSQPTIPPLGEAPEGYLLSRGFTKEILERFDIGGNTDRVWIPVKLRDGQVVGIVFRLLPEVEGDSRYILSYGFKRRNFLFGSAQYQANNDTVYVTEGALDCVRLHQIGHRNTVAILGAHPSSGQMGLLKKLGHQIVLAFDNDPPGREAALSVGKLLQHRGHSVCMLIYEGKDPGDLTVHSILRYKPLLSVLLDTHVLKPEVVSNII